MLPTAFFAKDITVMGHDTVVSAGFFYFCVSVCMH